MKKEGEPAGRANRNRRSDEDDDEDEDDEAIKRLPKGKVPEVD